MQASSQGTQIVTIEGDTVFIVQRANMVEAVRLFYRLDSCKSDNYYLHLQLVNRDSVINSLDESLNIAEEMHRLSVEGRETYKKALTEAEKKNNLLKWYLRSSILATVIIIIISL